MLLLCLLHGDTLSHPTRRYISMAICFEEGLSAEAQSCCFGFWNTTPPCQPKSLCMCLFCTTRWDNGTETPDSVKW